MEVEVDWDLQAVVRGCCTNNLKKQQQPHVEKVDQIFDSVKNLDQLFTLESKLHLDSFITTASIVSVPSTPPPQAQTELFHHLFRPLLTAPAEAQNQHLEASISSSNLSQPRNTTATDRYKRRKNQLKKVCEVPASGVAKDDKWSWRKYGQKPIKGSPYPRGYYRCSSSKGCPARKQVERSKTDPNKFIITYTSEHNHSAPTHRNSLAGISRHQNSKKLSSMHGTNSSSYVATYPSDDDDEMQQRVRTEDDQYDQLDEILYNELDDDFFDGLDEMRLPMAIDHQVVPI